MLIKLLERSKPQIGKRLSINTATNHVLRAILKFISLISIFYDNYKLICVPKTIKKTDLQLYHIFLKNI